MRELLFVTNNEHKLKEIRDIIGNMFRILSLHDIGFEGEIPEEEPDLEGNAIAKARFIYRRYGVDCFADDTGLEVAALHGRPGVRSARYAGDDCNPVNNIRKVLSELAGAANRSARFRTVICLIMDGKEHLFEGVVEGSILNEKRGNEGFGYDPVFLPAGHEQSFAEMPPELKNNISHRGRAMQDLIAFLTR